MAIKMGHAALTVSNTENTLGFYRDILGMQVAVDFGIQPAELKTGIPGSEMRVLLLSTDDGLQSIETFEFFDVDQRRLEGNARHTDYFCPHIAFLFSDIDGVYKKLLDAGTEVSIPLMDAGGYKFAYVFDPDGFLVELIQDAQ